MNRPARHLVPAPTDVGQNPSGENLGGDRHRADPGQRRTNRELENVQLVRAVYENWIQRVTREHDRALDPVLRADAVPPGQVGDPALLLHTVMQVRGTPAHRWQPVAA